MKCDVSNKDMANEIKRHNSPPKYKYARTLPKDQPILPSIPKSTTAQRGTEKSLVSPLPSNPERSHRHIHQPILHILHCRRKPARRILLQTSSRRMSKRHILNVPVGYFDQLVDVINVNPTKRDGVIRIVHIITIICPLIY